MTQQGASTVEADVGVAIVAADADTAQVDRRCVLNGAFAVLESLAAADRGLGLTDLSRASGLAKSSAYRLAEQLVRLGAVQRVSRRYHVGPRVGYIGSRWHPHPLLRQAGQAPVHRLAVQCRASAALRILRGDCLGVICATAQAGHLCTGVSAGDDVTARTATGRVLYAAKEPGEIPLPDCWAPREWRRLCADIRDLRATVIDMEDAFPGICCVSAPVWWPNGICAAAVTVVLHGTAPNRNVRELVVETARGIEAGLS